ncbi:MAG: Asp/Glu racemase, partial [Alphaproteobacteria bacterium]
INDLAISFLDGAGIETVSRADVGVALDNVTQGQLSPDAVFELGRRADSAEAEAIVLSCTDMRSIEVIERLEAALGKPVISSNQAMLFAACQTLGIHSELAGCGQLSRLAPRASVA